MTKGLDAEAVLKKIVAVVDGLGEAPSHDEAIVALGEIRDECVGHAASACSACTHPRSMHRPNPLPRHPSRTFCLGKTDSLGLPVHRVRGSPVADAWSNRRRRRRVQAQSPDSTNPIERYRD